MGSTDNGPRRPASSTALVRRCTSIKPRSCPGYFVLGEIEMSKMIFSSLTTLVIALVTAVSIMMMAEGDYPIIATIGTVLFILSLATLLAIMLSAFFQRYWRVFAGLWILPTILVILFNLFMFSMEKVDNLVEILDEA